MRHRNKVTDNVGLVGIQTQGQQCYNSLHLCPLGAQFNSPVTRQLILLPTRWKISSQTEVQSGKENSDPMSQEHAQTPARSWVKLFMQQM